jgi:Transposase
MRVVHERCCGLDVHKKTVVACILITQATGEVQRYIRTFSTMTAGLLALSDWLESMDVVVIALESTGVYWRPVFNLLEEGRTIILVNALHIKTVPGRKTDIKDSEWIADLLRHGLLQASFIPPAPIRELRDLARYRKTLVQERAQEVNRLHKVLETANEHCLTKIFLSRFFTPFYLLFFVDRATRSQALSWSSTEQQTRGPANDKRMVALRHGTMTLSPQIFVCMEMASTRCSRNKKRCLFPSVGFLHRPINLLRSLSASGCEALGQTSADTA